MSFICPFTNLDLLNKDVNYLLWERMIKFSYTINQKKLNYFSCKNKEDYIDLIKNNKDDYQTLKEIYENYKEKQREEYLKLEEAENIKKNKKVLESIYILHDNPKIIIRLMSKYSNDVFELYKDYKINADEYKSDEQIKEYIEQFILNYQIYEMLEDNILIGCVIHATKKFNIEKEKIDTFYIQEIFINEKYRNKKYGTILFNYMIQKCPDELDYISFITKPDNIAMFKIAVKYGFKLQNINMSLFICKKK
jgi:RimJ/RimL family protein N-acetyltransferase